MFLAGNKGRRTKRPADVVACRHAVLPDGCRLELSDAQAEEAGLRGRQVRHAHLGQVAHESKCALPYVW